ncbi:uncharacterized protein CDAR_229271 [Caerostris darwini]|uniref:Uncharacterized protein n=1 Tax=Caerostris darwini TaxID=1538125 RepID=A0AAV4PZ80_9ARAC|nr:uncharacterized protein CDAR_229271 [Caerostris darwini]
MQERKQKFVCFIFLLSFFVCFLLETVEASKKTKLAKAVANFRNVIERKMHKSHSRRWFPVWLIVLLVLGSSSMLGLVIFLYCYCRRSQTQSCLRPSLV